MLSCSKIRCSDKMYYRFFDYVLVFFLGLLFTLEMYKTTQSDFDRSIRFVWTRLCCLEPFDSLFFSLSLSLDHQTLTFSLSSACLFAFLLFWSLAMHFWYIMFNAYHMCECVLCNRYDIWTRALFRCGAAPAPATNSGNRDPIPDCSRSLCVNLKFRYFRFHMIILYIFFCSYTQTHTIHDGCFVSFVVIWARTHQINACTLYTLIGSMGFVYFFSLLIFQFDVFGFSALPLLSACLHSFMHFWLFYRGTFVPKLFPSILLSLGPFLFSLAFFLFDIRCSKARALACARVIYIVVTSRICIHRNRFQINIIFLVTSLICASFSASLCVYMSRHRRHYSVCVVCSIEIQNTK